jgi:hypothetical protein
VVHLQHANNSKVPVTLQLSQHDDGEHMQHVIKVSGDSGGVVWLPGTSAAVDALLVRR